LLDVHDAFIRNDPDVEVIVDPDQEREEPKKDKEGVLDKVKECLVETPEGVGVEEGEKEEGAADGNDAEDERDELHENVEPVPMNDVKNFFVVVLPFKAVGFVERWAGSEHRVFFCSSPDASGPVPAGGNFKTSFRFLEWREGRS